MKKFWLALVLLLSAAPGARGLTLEECIQKALAQNRALQAGRARLEAERSKVDQMRSAFYPTLSFSATYTRLGNAPGAIIPAFPPFITTPREITFGFKNNYLSRLTLNAPLFTWGKISGPYRIQQELAKVESLKLARSEEDVKLAVTELFWSVQALEKNLEVRKKAAESLGRHLKTVADKLSVGQASNFEQLRAKVELTNARVPIKETEAQLKTIYDRLRNLMGITSDSELNLQGELDFKPVPVSQAESIEKAKQNRTELKELTAQKGVLERSQALAGAENRPSLFVTSNAEYKNPFNAQKIWKFDWNAGAGISFPLFTGFHSRYKAEEIEFKKKALDLTQRETEAQIELEVKQALYELDAELAAQAAETAYLAAVSGYLITRARLEKALGAPIE